MPLTPAAEPALPLLDVHELSIRSGATRLVDQLSIRLERGDTLGIVGESGSGKSLTTLAILGLLPQSLTVTGRVHLEGESLLGSTPARLREIRGKRIGMIFQEPMTALNPLHTVGRQLSENLRLIGTDPGLMTPRMMALLAEVNLPNPESLLQRYPHQLSGGQRQRVMIAMALAQQPDILIADEPTTALDVTLQAQILDLLMQLQRDRHMSLILISHDLNLIRHYTRNVLVLQRGRLVEEGTTRQVFASPQAVYTRSLLNQNFGQAAKAVIRPDALPVVDAQQVAVRFPLKSGFFNRTTGWFTAVQPLSFQLAAGESLGVVGESGSGKTTLALALARLIASEGTIIINGTTVSGLSERQIRPLRSQFQMVFQDPFGSLNPRMTLEDIIGEGVLKRIPAKAQRRAAVEAVLQKVELPAKFADRYPHELSGGQRQRVALARALIMSPRLLILDEPTSALDRTTQHALVTLLRRLQVEEGLSYLFISHDLAVVRALCHRILVMHQGSVVELQETENLFTAPQQEYTRRLIEASRVGQG